MHLKRTLRLSTLALMIGLGGAFATNEAAGKGGGGGCPDQQCADVTMCAYYPGWWCELHINPDGCESGVC